MIELHGVSTRRAPLALARITLSWGPGVHAVVGGRADGGRELLALIAGAMRARRGKVEVLGGAPTDSRVRRQVAHIAAEASLPDALRVDEVLAIAADLRGDVVLGAAERLAVLGVEALARRPVRSLLRSEAHAVALAEALTSPAVRVVLVEEPLVAIEPRAIARVAGALRAKAGEGCAIVVATGSLRDAGELSDDIVRMAGGLVAGRTSSADALIGLGVDGARLVMVTADAAGARALASRLADSPNVDGIEYSARHRDGARGAAPEGTVLRIRGQDALVLAKAAARAAIDAGVDIVQLRVEPPSHGPARPASASALGASDAGTPRAPAAADSPAVVVRQASHP